jgi:dTDP-4-dehydrorhamnose 3,5-epimerase
MEAKMGAKLIDAPLFCDDRGSFSNIPLDIPDFEFKGKRVYICSNFEMGTVRGFHYHNFEAKVFISLYGAIRFVLISGAKTESMARTTQAEVFVLSDRIPKALYVPPDYANAWQSLTDEATLLGVSSATVEESLKDDIRFDPRVIDWAVKWR